MNVPTLLRPAVAEPCQVLLRKARPQEAGEIGALLANAFSTFQTSHGFQSDFGSIEDAVEFAAARIDDPLCYCVVALRDRKIIGVNFLSEGDPIRGVGPLAVAPDSDGRGLGRRLMHDVIERAGAVSGIRLLQDTFNLRSLALYTTLGFRAREPYVVLKGRLEDPPRSDRIVRPMEPADLPAVSSLAHDVAGFPRGCNVRRALSDGSPYVVQHGRRVTAYATDLGSWSGGHAVAATEDDFRALLLGVNATERRPLQFLFPTRQSRLFRWLLSQGMRAEKQMMLMTRGTYQDPEGIYLPSVLY